MGYTVVSSQEGYNIPRFIFQWMEGEIRIKINGSDPYLSMNDSKTQQNGAINRII